MCDISGLSNIEPESATSKSLGRLSSPHPNGDTTTLIVDVFDNASSTVSTTFTQALDNTQVKSDSNVYYLQESIDGKFEVYFGDGITGKALSDGNIVRLRYVVTNKTKANGASSFSTSAISATFRFLLVQQRGETI